jgi:DNA polymerase III epsilon subunit-like protein
MLPNEHFLAIDTETGGLNENRNPLLSVAFVHFDSDFTIRSKLHLHILPDPNKEIDQKAIEVNGYSHEEWLKNDAIPLRDSMLIAKGWLKAQRKAINLAHNAQFDGRFLLKAQENTGVDLQLSPIWICTKGALKLWRDIRGWSGKITLDALCEIAGIQRSSCHNALEDALACATGFKWLTDGFRNEPELLALWRERIRYNYTDLPKWYT